MNRKIKLLCTAAGIALILNACSGGNSDTAGGTNTGTPAVSGVLTDSPVEGATYLCGSVTQTTDKDGTFACEAVPVAFYVGNVKLGEVYQLPDDGYVTPQDLAGVPRDTYDTHVANIAVFLQSLDDDGEIETTITLDKALIEKLKEKHLELQQMTQEALVELLDQIGASDVVAREEALKHLKKHMDKLHTGEHEKRPKAPDNGGVEIPEATPVPTTEPDETETPPEKNVTTPIEVTPSPDEDNTTEGLDDALKQAYLEVINDARAVGRECGEYGYFPAVDPVTWNDKLYDAALEHSKDMATSNTFSHTGSGTEHDETAEALHQGTGSTVGERIEHNGYTNWQRYGENIAAGTVMNEASEAMEGWLESPGHCKNIMKAEFKEVGMAVYYEENSHYTYYWTQDFGSR